jgi:hypothetical protein
MTMARDITLKISRRLDASDAKHLAQRGYTIDHKAGTVVGRLYDDQGRIRRMIADGLLTEIPAAEEA